MNQIKQITFLIIFALLIFYPHLSLALDDTAKSAGGGLPVEIDADSIDFDQETNVYVAEGNVVARQSGIIIKADRIVIDMAKGYLVATGNLHGTDEGGNELSGDYLELDLDLGSALFLNGTLFFKDKHIYIRSEEIKKTGSQTYEAGYSTYTACDCDYEAGESPAWSISSRASRVTIGEYFAGWHSVFRVKRLPLFYLPYIKVPVKKERQTGFLLPTPGFSNVRGASLSNYFFWAISPTSDATVTYNHDTKRGRGAGLEFRHYSAHRSYSEFNFNYYREDDIDRVRTFRDNVQNLSRPLSADADRWELRFSHNQALTFSTKIRADVNIVSDDEYLIDFEKDKARRALPSLESTVSVTKIWELYSLALEFRRSDNLLSKNDENVLQKIPELTFTALPRKIFNSPLYISMNSSAVNYIRGSGEDGQRVDLAPKLSLPLRPGNLFEVTPLVIPRYTKYRVTGALGTTHEDRFIYEFRTDAVTTLIRDFAVSEDGNDLIRHSIRPRFSYVFIPDVDQLGLPSFDDVDAIAAANKLEYSVITTFIRRSKRGRALRRYEYLYFSLSQFYDIKERQRSLLNATDKREPFGNLIGRLRLRPIWPVRLSLDGDYDVYDGVFNSYASTIKLADRRGDNFYITYRNNRSLNTLYMESGARLRVNKALDLMVKQRYSFDEERSLETRIDAIIKQQCWSAILTYKRTPEDETIFLNFTLDSLGDIIALSESL